LQDYLGSIHIPVFDVPTVGTIMRPDTGGFLDRFSTTGAILAGVMGQYGDSYFAIFNPEVFQPLTLC
jgi:hypothetical protein